MRVSVGVTLLVFMVSDCKADEPLGGRAEQQPEIVGCVYGENEFAVGERMHIPESPCKKCTCGENGRWDCITKKCRSPKCGSNLQITRDGTCCPRCKRKCKSLRENCPSLSCPRRLRFYPDNSCCAECGCRYNGKKHPEGPFKSGCNHCECREGKVTCQPICPAQQLQCVGAARADDCSYTCPNGDEKTCQVGDTIIPYGEFKDLGNKICTCAGEWHPLAFCAPKVWPRFQKKNPCLAESVFG